MVVEALSLVQGCSISMKELQLSLIPVSPNLTQQSHPFLLVLVMAIVLFNGKDDGSDTGRERENRGRGGFDRGRGRGRGSEKGKGKVREKDVDEKVMDTDDFATGLYKGEDADGEKLARKIGPEIMNQLTEGFEEMTSRILPLPLEDEFLDALDINYAIEFEPEYLVEFDNPDIDEKEPIPLRDALEKAKPFLMSYEGIQSQEEWEIVDHYSGPDRVTAKKQQEELDRVAKILPESAPSSVKQFTNRSVISLQSNPGWGFDKKCHFLDKLVWEVSQHYN
ncbi:hypothetical protein HKD37_15G042555 [Glycine soja]